MANWWTPGVIDFTYRILMHGVGLAITWSKQGAKMNCMRCFWISIGYKPSWTLPTSLRYWKSLIASRMTPFLACYKALFASLLMC